VGNDRVSVAGSNRPTPASGMEVPIDLRVGVTGLTVYPAGTYKAVVVIRVTPGP
jgi:hypothetical protein